MKKLMKAERAGEYTGKFFRKKERAEKSAARDIKYLARKALDFIAQYVSRISKNGGNSVDLTITKDHFRGENHLDISDKAFLYERLVEKTSYDFVQTEVAQIIRREILSAGYQDLTIRNRLSDYKIDVSFCWVGH